MKPTFWLVGASLSVFAGRQLWRYDMVEGNLVNQENSINKMPDAMAIWFGVVGILGAVLLVLVIIMVAETVQLSRTLDRRNTAIQMNKAAHRLNAPTHVRDLNQIPLNSVGVSVGVQIIR